MNPEPGRRPVVLVTGASGYVEKQVIEALAREREAYGGIVALDIRPPIPADRLSGVEFVAADVRSPDLEALFQAKKPAIVVHLASIVTPGFLRPTHGPIPEIGTG